MDAADIFIYVRHLTRKRKKTAKRASGALIVYYRNRISRGIEICQKWNDDIIWFKLKSNFADLNMIFICFCNILPVNSSRQTLMTLSLLTDLLL